MILLVLEGKIGNMYIDTETTAPYIKGKDIYMPPISTTQED
jgi:hypothetical protein